MLLTATLETYEQNLNSIEARCINLFKFKTKKKERKVKMKTKHRNVKIMRISLTPRDTWKTFQKIGSKRFFLYMYMYLPSGME